MGWGGGGRGQEEPGDDGCEECEVNVDPPDRRTAQLNYNISPQNQLNSTRGKPQCTHSNLYDVLCT
jgi:hypothetical protein